MAVYGQGMLCVCVCVLFLLLLHGAKYTVVRRVVSICIDFWCLLPSVSFLPLADDLQ